MNNKSNNRWYDIDPTVSLAISFIRNLSYDEQTKIATLIIEKSKSFGIIASESRIVLNRRWYDENDDLSNAMEYLKLASSEIRKIIAIEIIDFLTKIK